MEVSHRPDRVYVCAVVDADVEVCGGGRSGGTSLAVGDRRSRGSGRGGRSRKHRQGRRRDEGVVARAAFGHALGAEVIVDSVFGYLFGVAAEPAGFSRADLVEDGVVSLRRGSP